MKRAVVLVGHGSKLEGSSAALEQVLSELQKKESDTLFLAAFLELQSPSIPQAIELCLTQGAKEVVIIPYFVQLGRHVAHDIPSIVREAKAKNPDRNIILASYLGFDERIVGVVEERIHQARRNTKVLS